MRDEITYLFFQTSTAALLKFVNGHEIFSIFFFIQANKRSSRSVDYRIASHLLLCIVYDLAVCAVTLERRFKGRVYRLKLYGADILKVKKINMR